MSHFAKRMKDNKGVTVIELLLALVLSTIVLAVVYSVLITGYKTYQKIAIEGAIRDEADYVVGRIMQTFYQTDISDIKNCGVTCIEIHSTETSKVSPSGTNQKVSITSLDELKTDGSTILKIKTDSSNHLVIETYKAKRVGDEIKVGDWKYPPETLHSDQFEFVGGSSLEATCAYSSEIKTDPALIGTDREKFISKKCNNGIVDITLNIKKKNIDDDTLQLQLKSQFGF